MPQIETPPRYKTTLAALPSLEVEYGAGGIKLLTDTELADGQIGYAVNRDGEPLIGWKLNWIVIGNDTGLGDPIILDIADPDLPVFTAWHGEGTWDLRPISRSVEAFAICFHAFAAIAKGRENPVQTKKDPLTEAERDAYLSSTSEAHHGQIGNDFWEALLTYGD